MKYALCNGILLDGTQEMKPVSGKILFVENGKISKIADQGTSTEEYEVMDLEGQYLLPGLINLHVHLPANGKPKEKETDVVKLVKIMTSNRLMRWISRKLCESFARVELESGVTTVRTVGGILDLDSRIRDMVAEGKTVGPRILASNMAISVPGGHMAGSLAYEAHSAQEAAEFVRRVGADHPDLIKLMITGGVLDAKVKGEPGEIKMPAEYVKAACDQAHKLGLKVAAHVESPEGVRIALENGVDTIEHGAKPDEEILRLFAEKGASHVATISPALPFALFDPKVSHSSEMSQYNGQIVFDGVISCAKACLENGIPVGLGTDTGCPFITHYDMWREIWYFTKYCGVTPAFALYTATLGNARIAGIDQLTGSLEEGKDADLLVVRENPLENIQALRNISMVAARGRWIRNPQVKKFPEVEQELDKFL